MTGIVRPAVPADQPAIERIVAGAYAIYIPRIGRPPAPMREDYAALIGRGTVWVTGEPVAGLIVLDDAPDHLFIDNVAVDPRRRGERLGRRLLDFAEAEARRRRHTEMRLYTHVAMTENVAMYPHLGWQETHRATQDGYHRVFFRKTVPP
jgi:GNAT superfamily N-acetyltransferase